MSTLALQSLYRPGSLGVGEDNGSSDDSSSSGLSSQIQQLLAALEQDILKQLSGQNESGQGDTSGSAPSSSATAGSPDDAGDAGSSGNTQQAMLEDILQVLLQLLQNNGQSQGTGDDQTNSMLADILQIVSQLLEGQGQQSAGSQSGSQPSADGADAASQSGDSTQSTLEEILLALLQMLEGGQGADTGTDADAGTDAGSQSGGASSDSEILQEITQLLQQLLDGGQNQDGSGATPDSLAAQDPTDDAAQPDPQSGIQSATPETDALPDTASPDGATPTVQGLPLQRKDTASADDNASGSAGDAGGGDTKSVIDQRLSTLGLGSNARAAIDASVEQESNFEADVNEGGARGAPTSDVAEDNSDGYGAFQLSGQQKQAFLDYCNTNGKNPADINAQMDFLEQDPQFTNAVQTLKNDQSSGASLGKMTEDFATGFEKATDMQMGNRLDYAQQLAAQS
jgi:hypothetical protein